MNRDRAGHSRPSLRLPAARAAGSIQPMGSLKDEIVRVARERKFSGAVRVDREGGIELAAAYGLADRGHGIANTVDTRFAIASGSKGLTALAVVSLIDEGRLGFSTPARAFLRDDLPLIGDDVTIEHLLSHRSGIGDYLDEDAGHAITDYVLTVPAHQLVITANYLAVLDGHPAKFTAGERFSYCNGGYVVLALIAERASGMSFAELVRSRVCGPAGMKHTEFLRSDELPGDVALGYLSIEGVSRTNVFHLPVVGSGDGGIYSTVADCHAFWAALFAGKIVPTGRVTDMVRPRSDVAAGSRRYGLGFWLHPTRDIVMLEGFDAGVSFRSVHDPGSRITHTVVSNTSGGAWPITRLLEELLSEGGHC
jgi:CubicO group peptidase (beta-lactamase class C family)